jgi:Carboxypeptidase regulatory-like domain
MRSLLIVGLVFGLTSNAWPQDAHRLVADALLEIHENGRTVYNNNDDYTGAYRLYQGGLMVARKMLADRPDLQKLISDGLAVADRQPTMDRRAYKLHELIETVRSELGKSAGKAKDHLAIPPRVVGSGTTPGPKPGATVAEVKDGVVGRVLWQGEPVGGVDVTFVTLGKQPPRVYQTTTSAQGVYSIPTLPSGKYVVLITAAAGATVKKLPDRYATSTTSPLTFDVKAGGEKLDFVLQ